MLKYKDIPAIEKIVNDLNLVQVGDEDFLLVHIKEALAKFPDKVEEYKAGKKGVIGLFMGEVMKNSQGKADPKKTSKLIEEELNK